MSANLLMSVLAVGLSLAAALLYLLKRRASALAMLVGAALFWAGMAVVAFGPRTLVESESFESGSMRTRVEIREAHPIAPYLTGGGAVLYVAGLLWFAAGVARKR